MFESVAKAIGLCQILFVVTDATKGSWVFLLHWLDPNIVALPLSLLLAVLATLATRHDAEHCRRNY
ncbi:hypothetical protein V6C53_12040 [Desulfocurvibacter africanus]|uniref:hypothetical protein n=1 Tax=Desulfocurvibacter africanus TaxID=873 RepID=UPI002FDA4077